MKRQRDDRGQTLLLAPIGLLIVVILGSVTLEVASVHLRQRQLDDLADTLANDAATVGFDIDEFRTSGLITIDETQAASILGGAIQASSVPSATVTQFDVTQGLEPEAAVALSYEYEYVLGKFLFGTSNTLTATGQAALELSA